MLWWVAEFPVDRMRIACTDFWRYAYFDLVRMLFWLSCSDWLDDVDFKNHHEMEWTIIFQPFMLVVFLPFVVKSANNFDSPLATPPGNPRLQKKNTPLDFLKYCNSLLKALAPLRKQTKNGTNISQNDCLHWTVAHQPLIPGKKRQQTVHATFDTELGGPGSCKTDHNSGDTGGLIVEFVRPQYHIFGDKVWNPWDPSMIYLPQRSTKCR